MERIVEALIARHAETRGTQSVGPRNEVPH
jgi:hypothetical protein